MRIKITTWRADKNIYNYIKIRVSGLKIFTNKIYIILIYKMIFKRNVHHPVNISTDPTIWKKLYNRPTLNFIC